MKVLVIGKEGQVASSLRERADRHPALDVVFASRPELDLTDHNTISTVVAAERPDVVISAAAFTDVDQAEEKPELARLVNVSGPGMLAEAAHEVGAKIIHLSTDYVFDGTSDRAYLETDEVSPLGIYGLTKYEGECAVSIANPDHLILRTAWIYSPYRKNFLKTMLGLAKVRETISVVDDQTGNPTSSLDIADGIFDILEAWARGLSKGLGQIYHLTGTGEASWFEFAQFIFETSGRFGGPTAKVLPISSEQYAARARRPENSRLNCDKLKNDFGYQAPDWKQSAIGVVNELMGHSRSILLDG